MPDRIRKAYSAWKVFPRRREEESCGSGTRRGNQRVIVLRRWRNFFRNNLRPQEVAMRSVKIKMVSEQLVNHLRAV